MLRSKAKLMACQETRVHLSLSCILVASRGKYLSNLVPNFFFTDKKLGSLAYRGRIKLLDEFANSPHDSMIQLYKLFLYVLVTI